RTRVHARQVVPRHTDERQHDPEQPQPTAAADIGFARKKHRAPFLYRQTTTRFLVYSIYTIILQLVLLRVQVVLGCLELRVNAVGGVFVGLLYGFVRGNSLVVDAGPIGAVPLGNG